jgi:hypothetical protein
MILEDGIELNQKQKCGFAEGFEKNIHAASSLLPGFIAGPVKKAHLRRSD